MADRQDDRKGDVLTRTHTQTKKPRRYKVLLHNDDYTTMEFVIWVLQSVFKHSPAAAHRIMLLVHKQGVGVAGIYTRNIAETRVDQVLSHAREAGHPLQCTMEPE